MPYYKRKIIEVGGHSKGLTLPSRLMRERPFHILKDGDDEYVVIKILTRQEVLALQIGDIQ